MKPALAVVAATSLVIAAAQRPGRLDTWRRDAAGAVSGAAAADLPVPVGSLQKPFVAKAWAAAHVGDATPRWDCDGRSCWRPSGHGTVGLTRATAVSCNAFFLALAAQTPPAVLRSILEADGFVVDGAMTPEAAIGLGDTVTITPRRLLDAYARLTRTPWLSGDAVRRETLAGLRQAAGDGTARGLGRRGFWAKTGTVDAPGHRGLETIGWVVAVDDAGSSTLARLSPGTGRQAATALGSALGEREVSADATAAPDRVRVLLFEALRPRSIRVTNRGSAAATGSRGFVGPGASRWLQPGDRLGESLWELRLPESSLIRTVRAALDTGTGGGGGLEVVADMAAREYVTGVLGAELGRGTPAQRVALGAAALRLRAHGPRHARADFCDTTHCAWFIGRGPRLRWPSPRRAIAEGDAMRPVEDEEWARMVEDSRRPGPMYWTSHCGGRPLSAWAVWGSGDRTAASCPLHAGTSRAWSRSWPDDALARAFGGRVTRIEVAPEDGVWRLFVATPGQTRRLLYDDAHRALAAVLGWDALPSPPDRVTRAGAGYRAEGAGSGHRVGLCLGGGADERPARSARREGTDGDDHPLELGDDRGLGFRGTE